MTEEFVITKAWELLSKEIKAFRNKVGTNVPITQINFDTIISNTNIEMEDVCPGYRILPVDYKDYIKHGVIKVQQLGFITNCKIKGVIYG